LYPPLDVLVNVHTVERVDFRNNKDLKAHHQKIHDVHVNRLDFTVTNNDLTHVVQKMDIFIGKAGITEFEGNEDQLSFLTTLPTLQAGQKGEFVLPVGEDGRNRLVALLREMEMTVVAVGYLEVDTVENSRRPAGGIDAELTMRLTAVASLLGEENAND
jgi:hypothetical protein